MLSCGQTNKQMPLKTCTSLRYTTPVDKNVKTFLRVVHFVNIAAQEF